MVQYEPGCERMIAEPRFRGGVVSAVLTISTVEGIAAMSESGAAGRPNIPIAPRFIFDYISLYARATFSPRMPRRPDGVIGAIIPFSSSR
jgi:hypothetical protein